MDNAVNKLSVPLRKALKDDYNISVTDKAIDNYLSEVYCDNSVSDIEVFITSVAKVYTNSRCKGRFIDFLKDFPIPDSLKISDEC